MARYIDADKLVEELKENSEFKSDLLRPATNEAISCGLSIAIDTVKKAPTVNVKADRHGSWSTGQELSGSVYAHCSACNRKMNDYCYGYAYCPLCGARMDR